MSNASYTARLRSISGLRRTWILAACTAATAAGGVAVLAGSSDDVVPAQPAPLVAPQPGGDDLSRYDSALLHHHGVRVPRSTPAPVEPTAAQRSAADRFHHR